MMMRSHSDDGREGTDQTSLSPQSSWPERDSVVTLRNLTIIDCQPSINVFALILQFVVS